jgi:hypothetical protein
LAGMKARTAEIYFHPSMSSNGNGLGPNKMDLATLLSPAVRTEIERRGYRITSYHKLGKEV